MASTSDVIATFVDELIDEGNSLRETEFTNRVDSITRRIFVDLQAFQKWRTSCKLLMSQLGTFSSPWSSVLDCDQSENGQGVVMSMIGALESIRENIARGRLSSFEDLVFAEAFANLVEQGEYLLDKGFFLAAGVIFRAVLEERLRRMCDRHGVTPDKDRPTINDYNQAMYKAKIYDKIELKNVEALAAIGNAAAHGSDELQSDAVEQLRGNLMAFLAKYSSS